MSDWIKVMECANLIDDFKLEKHLDETINGHLARDFYRQRLDDMIKTAESMPLKLDFKKFKIERVEKMFYEGIYGYDKLVSHIERYKPKEISELSEETVTNAIRAFVSLVVDKYFKGAL